MENCIAVIPADGRCPFQWKTSLYNAPVVSYGFIGFYRLPLMPIHSGETNKKSRLLICNHPTKRVPPSPLSKYWQALVVVNFISYLLSHLKMSWQLCISINSFDGDSLLYQQQQLLKKNQI